MRLTYIPKWPGHPMPDPNQSALQDRPSQRIETLGGD